MGEGQGGGEKVPCFMLFAALPSPWPPPIKGGGKIYKMIYLSKVDNQNPPFSDLIRVQWV